MERTVVAMSAAEIQDRINLARSFPVSRTKREAFRILELVDFNLDWLVLAQHKEVTELCGVSDGATSEELRALFANVKFEK